MFNTQMLMKNAINHTLTVLTAAALYVTGSFRAAAVSPESAMAWDWQFAAGANPAEAGLNGGAGAAQATIAAGEFSSGWMANNSILGAAQGIWDLGRNGTINLKAASSFASSGGVLT